MKQRLMVWDDLLGRPKVSPQQTIRWGQGATDVVDVWLPDGAGPFPVVLMVHGGCWQKSIADRTLMNWAAEDLRSHGLAVWNIEYRGVDEQGGGYPGTFLDVAHAADALRDHAAALNLDTKRVAAFGHSAGGHLVMWLAARANLPKSSPLYMDNPSPAQWLNPNAFTKASLAGFGNAGRNILEGPGLMNLDFSATKNTTIREGIVLQFRAEVFNILNHPNFGQPVRQVTSTQYGQITATRATRGDVSSSRQIQLGMKLVF